MAHEEVTFDFGDGSSSSTPKGGQALYLFYYDLLSKKGLEDAEGVTKAMFADPDFIANHQDLLRVTPDTVTWINARIKVNCKRQERLEAIDEESRAEQAKIEEAAADARMRLNPNFGRF